MKKPNFLFQKRVLLFSLWIIYSIKAYFIKQGQNYIFYPCPINTIFFLLQSVLERHLWDFLLSSTSEGSNQPY